MYDKDKNIIYTQYKNTQSRIKLIKIVMGMIIKN